MPLVTARCGYQATVALERRAEHRLFGNRFRAGIEHRRRFLGPLLPPGRYEAPSHRYQVALGVAPFYRVNRSGGADIVSSG